MSSRTSLDVVVFSTLFLTLLATTLPPPLFAAGGEQAVGGGSYILVSGEAEHSVAPDQATLGLAVIRQSAKAQDAQEEAGNAIASVLAAIHRRGVNKDDVQTSALDLTPLRSAPGPGPSYDQNRPITGYRATIALTLKITDLSSVGAVLDAAVGAGANRVNYLSFGLIDERPARREALAAAARDARAKAETLAHALNFRLGSVLEVAEGGTLVQPRYATDFARAMSSTAAAQSTPIASGKVRITAKVTMKVRIASQLKSIAVPAGGESSRPNDR